MDALLLQWVELSLRWLHVIAAMAWIGASFYFMHIDAALRAAPDIPAGKGGEAWEVHGGGFYNVRKYLIAPERLPGDLIWHKWESYTTWLSGFALLVVMYYLNADLYLIDPAIRPISSVTAASIGVGALILGWLVYDRLCRSPLAENETLLAAIGFALIIAMAWALQQVFSGRGAFIHTGALIATLMTGNVFLNIMPNQRIVIADLKAGRTPDARYGKEAKTRSRHNNYLTLPVVFLMLSGHYPFVFLSPYAWVMVGLVIVAGAFIRHFYNERHAGRGNPWWTWGVAILAMLAVVALTVLTVPAGRMALGFKMTALTPPPDMTAAVEMPMVPPAVSDILGNRCAMCHSEVPQYPGLVAPPKGVRFDTPSQMAREAPAILLQAVLTQAMPPNNITGLTPEERSELKRWLLKG